MSMGEALVERSSCDRDLPRWVRGQIWRGRRSKSDGQMQWPRHTHDADRIAQESHELAGEPLYRMGQLPHWPLGPRD